MQEQKRCLPRFALSFCLFFFQKASKQDSVFGFRRLVLSSKLFAQLCDQVTWVQDSTCLVLSGPSVRVVDWCTHAHVRTRPVALLLVSVWLTRVCRCYSYFLITGHFGESTQLSIWSDSQSRHAPPRRAVPLTRSRGGPSLAGRTLPGQTFPLWTLPGWTLPGWTLLRWTLLRRTYPDWTLPGWTCTGWTLLGGPYLGGPFWGGPS